MTINALLTVGEMYAADAAAEEAGVASLDLMETAGSAVVSEIRERWERRPVTVLCGPGNNGGDGFVIARLLKEERWPVSLALLGDKENLKGDAAANAQRWLGSVEVLEPSCIEDGALVVDAMFGAGLGRPLEGAVLETVHEINTRNLECIAVDMPSGVHGNTGEILGGAPDAQLTVTFFRAKPGHVLLPGRAKCGETVVADIGIPESVLDTIKPMTAVNGPALWDFLFPWPDFQSHKYARGHLTIVGGREMTGAARLATDGARRIGAGLVTIAAHPDAVPVYAAGSPGNLVKPVSGPGAVVSLLDDPRRNAVLIGPGLGTGGDARDTVLGVLSTGKPAVLDADALTAFEDDPETLLNAIHENCLLTPHEGEFARIFELDGDKPSRTREAASQAGAAVLLKGADTVVATPDGRAVINASGTPFLATAGSGDVLAGMASGLMAQGLGPFDSAIAATWIHGAAAEALGPGLIAEDLLDTIPEVLGDLMHGMANTS